MFKGWGRRDWVWLVCVLVGIIFIILIWRLNDNNSVVNIISMFSSGASIVLAIVAIMQSTIYNRSTNELDMRLNEKLTLLENNMDFVKKSILSDAKEVIEHSDIGEDEKAEIKMDLENKINPVMSKKEKMLMGLKYHDILFKKLKKAYESKFIVEKEVVKRNNKVVYGDIDILIQNDKVIYPIEIKYYSNFSKVLIMRAVEHTRNMKNIFNEQGKICRPILVIIANRESEKMQWMIDYINKSDIDIIIYTEYELLNYSSDEIASKISLEDKI